MEKHFADLKNVSILINNAGLGTFGFCGNNDPWNYQSFLSCMYVDTFLFQSSLNSYFQKYLLESKMERKVLSLPYLHYVQEEH